MPMLKTTALAKSKLPFLNSLMFFTEPWAKLQTLSAKRPTLLQIVVATRSLFGPEGTAGAVRAYVSEGLAQNNPNKLYYYRPMFRYERPQKGRYRQFYQFGVEVLGLESPWADVGYDLAYTILKNLNLHTRCELQINTLGDIESRNAYREALVKFLTPLKDQLSEDSKVRLEKNPLRILDSKDENDRKLIATAPAMEDFMTENTKVFFRTILEEEAYKIKYPLQSRIQNLCVVLIIIVTPYLSS